MKTLQLISEDLWENRRILLISTLVAAPLGLGFGKVIYGLLAYSLSAATY